MSQDPPGTKRRRSEDDADGGRGRGLTAGTARTAAGLGWRRRRSSGAAAGTSDDADGMGHGGVQRWEGKSDIGEGRLNLGRWVMGGG